MSQRLGLGPDHHGYRCFDPQNERLYIVRHVRFNELCFPYAKPHPTSSTTPAPDPYISLYPNPDPLPTQTSHPPPAADTPSQTDQLSSDPVPPSPSPIPVSSPPLLFTYQRRPKPIPTTDIPADQPPTTAHSVDPTPLGTTTQPNPSLDSGPPIYDPILNLPNLIMPVPFTLPPLLPIPNPPPLPLLIHCLNGETPWLLNIRPCIDYEDTLSPVVKATTIRLVLSLAVTQKWALRQLDVQNAFLHGDLKETVYLQQPQGFVDPKKPDHVCLLHKSLYGLNQAPRAWFHRLSSTLHELGNNQGAIDNVVHHLGRTFPDQDMGKLSYFLGIEIVSQGADILLSQQKYIMELLQKAGLSNAKSASSPISTSANLALNDNSLFDNPVKYRQVVGALQYATFTRPDITYAINKVCQFMHSPTENHWSTVKRILRYLKGTVSHGLLIQQQSSHLLHAYADSTHNSLSAFSDADWAGCPDDRRSTWGYAIYLGSNLVSWSARKQKTVYRSSTESEYKALADAVAELTWIQALLLELRVTVHSPPTLWCDNLGATYLSANPVFHARTKHVEIDFHFVCEKVARRQLSVQFITTDDQIADVFTKPLPFQRFLFLRSKLRVAPRP
ncbi:hypothetical protein OSB04_015895 [Centaurea solstitialis]|uniref:Reverse transcriptase Ty1/copia-type domain-containing protein n=1 Tax=Centaurea solstitialis TaxID=347529 RepID=A0AA38SZW5_9ASTR|nr:hypothetical protein OSB04_015895 [Centaurea solstitialis]